MNNYKIVLNKKEVEDFIQFLPNLLPNEVFYLTLFARPKYIPDNKKNEIKLANNKNSNCLNRILIKEKEKLIDNLYRLETPIESYSRNKISIPQEVLAVYITLNPRSLNKANKNIIKEMIDRFTKNDFDFDPITIAKTEIHKAVGRKFFLDFDFDIENNLINKHINEINNILPSNSYKILKTRGGFHLIVILEEAKKLDFNWYTQITKLENCDVRGSNTMCPIPGCIQGDFSPYFLV